MASDRESQIAGLTVTVPSIYSSLTELDAHTMVCRSRRSGTLHNSTRLHPLIIQMLKEYLVTKTLDASFSLAKEAVRGILREKKVRLTTTRDEIQASLEMHIQSINNWSEEVSFNDLRKAKLTTEVFIPLDLFVYPRRFDANSVPNHLQRLTSFFPRTLLVRTSLIHYKGKRR